MKFLSTLVLIFISNVEMILTVSIINRYSTAPAL